jgi:hypothetical protein
MNVPYVNLERLVGLIEAGEAAMSQADLALWRLIRIPPATWQIAPWGTFWAVAIVGGSVIWYNDIEGGFNVSPYTIPGNIGSYWADQAELQHVVSSLTRQVLDTSG